MLLGGYIKEVDDPLVEGVLGACRTADVPNDLFQEGPLGFRRSSSSDGVGDTSKSKNPKRISTSDMSVLTLVSGSLKHWSRRSRRR